MTTVFSMTASHNVHDVHVKTKKDRLFVIDIYEASTGVYDSTVTVLDRISIQPCSGLYKTTPTSSLASDNFKAAVEFVQKYLGSVDSSDSITEIHNPCNCPFVFEADQNTIVNSLGLPLKVRVN